MSKQPISWFVKAGAVLIVTLAICWTAPRTINGIPEFPATTTDREQQLVFDAYFLRPTPTVAIVGSSLAMRLKEEYFSHLDIENVSIPGGSPLTGLEIIVREAKRKPRIVLAETNILSRGVDNALIDRYESHSVEILRPLRAIAASLQAKPVLPHQLNDSERDAILRSAPRPIVPAYQKIAAETVPEFNKPSYDAVIRRDAAMLKALVEKVQADGVKVYLFEMPVSPNIARTRYYETVHSEVSRLFRPVDMLHLDYKLADLHWDDGEHLDERSSLIVSGTLEHAIATKIDSIGEDR
jgi:hypothetical protein